MRSTKYRASALATREVQRLLRDATVTANASKKLVDRVRSKLQSPRSDVIVATIVDHVDSIEARSLDILQALLQVLMSQVSAEKFQAVNRRLLVIAARRGHEEILGYLNANSVNTGYSHGEALGIAVFQGDVSCVRILLREPPSIHSIARALLTTDYVDLSQARAMIRPLLDFRLPHSLLDYLTLKMSAASQDDYDTEIFSMLTEATNRDDAQEMTGEEIDSWSLYAYFDVQKQVRTSLTNKRISSSSSTVSTRSVQMSMPQKPSRNMFGDEAIRSPDNLIAKLLVRFLTNCAATKGSNVQWSLRTLNMLLEKLPPGAEELPEYRQALFLAASFQQTTVYTRLLRHRSQSFELPDLRYLEVIVKSVETTEALMDFLNESYDPGHAQYRLVIECLFACACQAQNLPAAIQICARSRIPIAITPAREFLKAVIESGGPLWEVAELLKSSKVEESDLDALWECVLVPVNFPTETARMLLEAGCKSLAVAKTFLRCVQFDEEFSTLSMILKEWKITKTTAIREKFDYSIKMSVASRRSGVPKLDSHYYSTLATAMSIAIDRQQSDLCQLLLDKGAPIVLEGTSLLETAVRRGTVQCSLEQDKVLKSIIDSEKQHAEVQVVLDYALLQAVKYERPQLAADLVNQGASTTAYKYEVWRVAFQANDEAMLCSLLTTSHSAFELSKSFMAIFASFSIDPKTWISLCHQLHKAGYVNPKCYSWVLSVLCLCNKATTLSAEQLLSYGPSVCDELDQSLEQCWLHGNLPVFRVLIENGISQHAAEALFQSMTKDVMDLTNLSKSAGEDVCHAPRSAIVLDAIDLLLQQNLPKRLKDTALCSIAVSYRKPASQRIPVLRKLLEKGARFSEDDGFALLNCLLIDDKALMDQINASRPPLKARQSAIQFAIHFPNDMGDPAPSQRFHALAQLLYPLPSTTSIILSDQHIMDITGIFLSPNSDTPTTLIHHFYGWLRNRSPSGLSDLEHCWTVEKKLNTIFEGLAGCKDQQMQFIERITAVLAWTRPEPDSAIGSARYFNYFWLPRKSLSRYLIEASKAGLTPVVGALLEAGVSPNVFDESGSSALFWATSKNEPTVVLLLMDAGADLNDGSLHEAMCQQHQAIMKLLLKAGHDRMWSSPLHEDATPLLSFIQFDHNISEVTKFPVTVNILMTGRQFTTDFCRDLKSAVEVAITRQHAFQLILALLPWLRKSFDAQREIFESPIAKGPLRYSLLSLIDRWEVNYLNRSQRNSLVLSFQGVGFEEAFYAVQGDQPGNAINVPEAILLAEEARKRRIAFETKECCIHGDKAESEKEIHAALMPSCDTSHSWKNDIVCTDCLKQYLESRMFPHDDVTIKYKFPATKIPCWAPKCPSTELSYNVLQEHADPEIFHLYDLALCQALLREGKSMVKCATQDCPGAHWYDEHDLDDDLKIFFCDICYQNTCLECNDHYEKHDGLPCPAGEDSRKSERIKEEEKLSEEALKLEKKCPKCNLMYEKYFGCDHIVCGKNVYDNKVDKGCRFEFCDICFGAWPNGHTRSCVHRI